MLTAEIKINGRPIALIEAKNVKTLSDKMGDFIGDRATVCEYKCRVLEQTCITWQPKERMVTVIHDRRFGWQGLVNKITSEIMPIVVETVNAEEYERLKQHRHSEKEV